MIISLVSRTPSRLLLILAFHLVACQKERLKREAGKSLLEEINEQINGQINGQVKKEIDAERKQSVGPAGARSFISNDRDVSHFFEFVGLCAIIALCVWACCQCCGTTHRQGKKGV